MRTEFVDVPDLAFGDRWECRDAVVLVVEIQDEFTVKARQIKHGKR
jgi:hypothetical protein